MKKVWVQLFGHHRRKIQIDAEATKGAKVGDNLLWPDGSTVQEDEIRNTSGGGTSGSLDSSQVISTPSLWSLILGIPSIISSLAALAENGWLRNDSATISASYWPYNQTSVATGDELTIPSGHELIVFDSFTMDGSITLDGDLVVLE